jgi:hypothetical protein
VYAFHLTTKPVRTEDHSGFPLATLLTMTDDDQGQ